MDNQLKPLVPKKIKPAKKKREVAVFSEEDDLVADERWLLSYSDLMTLMFGFFVILYALSFEERHKFDSLVRSLAIGDKNRAASVSEVSEIQEEGSNPTSGVITEVTDGTETNLSSVESPTEIETKNLKSQVDTITLQKSELEQKIKTLESEKSSLKTEKEEIQKQLELKTVAMTNSKSSSEDESKNDKKEIESLKKEIEKLKQEQKASAANQSQESSQTGGQNQNSSYLSSMIYWTTQDHDLDLTIQTPSKKKYDFKNRKYKDKSGELILDTRRGPGAEIWHADQAEEGIYTLTVNLYSQYDNKEPASVGGHLSTIKGVIALPEFKLDAKQRRQVFKFKLDKDSKVELIK